MIFTYYNNHKNDDIYDKSSINYKNINFETGDILQEVFGWNDNNRLFGYLFKVEFSHCLFIIKFKNKNYLMHYTARNFGYPKNILSFDSKYLEIFLLDDYFIDNYHSKKYYRIFKPIKPIDNDIVFNFLKKLDIENLQFSHFPCIKDCLEHNYFNCMTFILRILSYTKIIPEFNFYNSTPNDLKYLPKLSNNYYNDPIIIKV